jgi:hypothetical protein
LPTGTTTAAGGSGIGSSSAILVSNCRLDAVLEKRHVRLGSKRLPKSLASRGRCRQTDLGAEPVDQGDFDSRAGRA